MYLILAKITFHGFMSYHRSFYRFERKESSITRYFADFKRMYEELNALLPISNDVQQMQL